MPTSTEIPVTEIQTIAGRNYRVMNGSGDDLADCRKCAFEFGHFDCLQVQCDNVCREDGRSVYFVEV
ncbi:hypothetical protein HOP38_02590 [Vibrio mediterranei]|uniref:hypothetical protein n=1 Tax=Vibrio mediterranei TaxID=689 RepID=UPI001803CAA2|nr:hypothetical protein [Vibrio mediterranei]NUW71398.1 hypothetical protein [Vibrio mediterranei]